eukprot:CFRG3117T1
MPEGGKIRALEKEDLRAVAQKNDKYVAHHDFYAQWKVQLPLRKGDVVNVLEGPKGGWWLAEIGDCRGWIPSNYVSMASKDILEKLARKFGDAVHVASEASRNIQRRRSSTMQILKPQPPTPKSSSQTVTQGTTNTPLSSMSASPPPIVSRVNRKQIRPASTTGVLQTGTDRRLEIGIQTMNGVSTCRSNSSSPIVNHKNNMRLVSSKSTVGSIKNLREFETKGDCLKYSVKKVGGETLWSDGVRADLLAFLGKDEVNRQNRINEIISTERNYVYALEILTNIFMEPIRKKKLLDNRTMTHIFSNLEMIFPIHQRLLETLESRRSSDNTVIENIGDAFGDIIPYFKMYSLYVSNYPVSIDTLMKLKSKSILEFLETCKKLPACRKMGLNSLLLEPVQRLCRYPLLLREVYKYTDINHPDKALLETAISRCEATVSIVNEQQRNMECLTKTVELAERLQCPSIVTLNRALMCEFEVEEISKDGITHTVSYIHFFNDGVMVSKLKRAVIGTQVNKIIMPPTTYHLVKVTDLGTVRGKKRGSGARLSRDGTEFHIQLEAHTMGPMTSKRVFASRTKSNHESIIASFNDKGHNRNSDFAGVRDGTQLGHNMSIGTAKYLSRSSSMSAIPSVKTDYSTDATLSETISMVSESEAPSSNSINSSICSDSTAAKETRINRRMQKIVSRSEKAYSGDFGGYRLSSNLWSQQFCRLGVPIDVENIHISDCVRDAKDPFNFLYKLHLHKDQELVCYRSYNDYFDLHVRLSAQYPPTVKSAGRPESILPDLIPPRPTLSHEAAMDLTQPLTTYLQNVLRLPEKKSHSSIVTSFLEMRRDSRPQDSVAFDYEEIPLAPFPWGMYGNT